MAAMDPYNCGMTKNETTAAIIAAIDTDIDTALDMIVEHAVDMDRTDVDAIIDAAYAVDPFLESIGAEIRDALRDNTDFRI